MSSYGRLHAAGVLLLAATAVNWLASGWTKHWAWLVVLVIAGLKCRIVMREFMELHAAPLVWRGVFDLWLSVVMLLVAGARWVALGG